MDRESFFCPITRTVMQDPVVDPEGNTYEREAIESWLQQHQSSPITRTPLFVEQLVPNRALREVIQEELKKATDSGDTQWIAPKTPLPAVVQQQEQAKEELEIVVADPESIAKAEEVELKVTASKDANDVLIHASIIPGPGLVRSPADICCVVDISGSMGAEASVKTGTGKEEKHGLSLLDIVKHAVKTVVHSLDAKDRFGLVVFSTTARVVFELTSVDKASKTRIFNKIDGLQPEDTTNLWDGLVKGLEVLKKSTPGRASSLILLTDGLPNISPPRGELAMLKRHKASNKQLDATINTFGFGYAIDTSLLLNLAIEGHGMHSFIPDASFVGTAFVNCISNLLVTMGDNVTLSIKPQQGAQVKQVLGGYISQLTPSGAQVNAVSLQYGQTKDILVRLSVPPTVPPDTDYVSVSLHFENVRSGEAVDREVACSSFDNGGVDLEVHHLRLDFVSTINHVLELIQSGKDKEAQAALSDITERVRQCQDPRAKALLQDLTGQVQEAIQKTPENYYQKWGRHYLPSLARAHLLQQCNNFKDPGIQVYGGELFQKKRDQIDDIFLKLPPPKPSVRRSTPSHSSSYMAAPSMSHYHNAAGPCFAGECAVRMATGIDKQVRDIVRGDTVMGPEGPAVVECVIKTHCVGGKEDLVIFPNGLRVTPFHPVVDTATGKWCFPVDLHPMQRDVPCDAVYNFVLRSGHIMMIQGVKCVTLGHGIVGDEVVSHTYFGTSRIVDDLRAMRGWHAGVVELFPALCPGGTCMSRDKETGLVCGFVSAVTVAPRDV